MAQYLTNLLKNSWLVRSTRYVEPDPERGEAGASAAMRDVIDELEGSHASSNGTVAWAASVAPSSHESVLGDLIDVVPVAVPYAEPFHLGRAGGLVVWLVRPYRDKDQARWQALHDGGLIGTAEQNQREITGIELASCAVLDAERLHEEPLNMLITLVGAQMETFLHRFQVPFKIVNLPRLLARLDMLYRADVNPFTETQAVDDGECSSEDVRLVQDYLAGIRQGLSPNQAAVQLKEAMMRAQQAEQLPHYDAATTAAMKKDHLEVIVSNDDQPFRSDGELAQRAANDNATSTGTAPRMVTVMDASRLANGGGSSAAAAAASSLLPSPPPPPSAQLVAIVDPAEEWTRQLLEQATRRFSHLASCDQRLIFLEPHIAALYAYWESTKDTVDQQLNDSVRSVAGFRDELRSIAERLSGAIDAVRLLRPASSSSSSAHDSSV